MVAEAIQDAVPSRALGAAARSAVSGSNLLPGTVRFELVTHMLRERLSPAQSRQVA